MHEYCYTQGIKTIRVSEQHQLSGERCPTRLKMLSSLRLLYLIIPSILSHRTLRYSGSHHEQISSPVAEEWFDSAGGCANYCSKTAGCGAYSTLHYGEDSAETFRGYKCQIGGESYSTTPTSSPWVLWKPKSSTNSARSVTTVSNTGKDECRIV